MMPSRASTVGPTSESDPPLRSAPAPARTATKGTGLVVWAVCGPPVSGSTIISQFPWSAVTRTVAPEASAAVRTLARHRSTVSTASTTAGMTPVWPTMSAFA